MGCWDDLGNRVCDGLQGKGGIMKRNGRTTEPLRRWRMKELGTMWICDPELLDGLCVLHLTEE